MINIILSLITDGYTDYLVGTNPVTDFVYSVLSFHDTGVIMEDSVFFDCATMGNKVC